MVKYVFKEATRKTKTMNIAYKASKLSQKQNPYISKSNNLSQKYAMGINKLDYLKRKEVPENKLS